MYTSADYAGWKRARAAQHARKLVELRDQRLQSGRCGNCGRAGADTCVALCVPSLRTDASQLL